MLFRSSIFSHITRFRSVLPVIVYLSNFYLYLDGLWLVGNEKMKMKRNISTMILRIIWSTVVFCMVFESWGSFNMRCPKLRQLAHSQKVRTAHSMSR